MNSPHRRAVMFATAAAVAALAGRASAAVTREDFRRLGYDALIYLLPLYEMAAARARTLSSGQAQNVFRHARKLANAKSWAVTTPNSDTLYSSAWIDLSNAVEIALPRTGDRYFSLALMDAYSNNFAVLGGVERTGAETLRLFHADGRRCRGGLRSPTRMVWALARTYAGGEGDLAGAHAVQDQLRILTPSLGNPGLAPAPPRSNTLALLAYAQAALRANPPPAADRAVLRRLAPLGFGPGGMFPPDDLGAAQREDVAAGAAQALVDLQVDETKPINGWLYEKPDTGVFGRDYLNRARVALTGLAALPISEALYLKGAGDLTNGDYDGAVDHRIVFPRGDLPPTDAFWSVTLYEPTVDGQLFFFDNPQGIYSVGSNSGPLAAAPDGTVTLLISARPPEPDLRRNWLPAPPGRFRLQFRVYRPGKALMSGSYRVPPVLRGG